MLVEKKSWKNLIRPVTGSLLSVLAICLLWKIVFYLDDKNPSLITGVFFILSIAASVIIIINSGKYIDYQQVEKINNLEGLDNLELNEYLNKLYKNGKGSFNDDEALNIEYNRVLNEIESRIKSDLKNTEIINIEQSDIIYIDEVMRLIMESNVIPTINKESLKEDILSTYRKNIEKIDVIESFETSRKNAKIFKAALNRVKDVGNNSGDYGLLYEYNNLRIEEIENLKKNKDFIVFDPKGE